MSNSTPSTPPSDDHVTEHAESEPGEDSGAEEARLLELKHEVQRMRDAEYAPDNPARRWPPEYKLEWITEEQAQRLYERWLGLQIRRHFERPDVYGEVRSHNGPRIKHMLAYVTEKTMRLQEIQAEVRQVQERCSSQRVVEQAAEIMSECELLEELYSETGDRYGRIFRPYEKRGLR